MFSQDQCLKFSPPQPINKFFYKCDKVFHLDDLLKLYHNYDNYAIVLISGKRVELFLYSETQTKLLKSLDMVLMNQHKTGGQSAQRFGRIRDEKIAWYVTKIVELMINYYTKDNLFTCKGMIMAGPAEMKDMVSCHDLFVQYFSKYLLKTLTISEITNQSIHQVIQLASNVLGSETDEKKIIEEIEQMLMNPDNIDLIVFGNNEVLQMFNDNQLREILVADTYVKKDAIIRENHKTKIHIVKSTAFVAKYGELIGVRYYSSYFDYDSEVVSGNHEVIEI